MNKSKMVALIGFVVGCAAVTFVLCMRHPPGLTENRAKFENRMGDLSALIGILNSYPSIESVSFGGDFGAVVRQSPSAAQVKVSQGVTDELHRTMLNTQIYSIGRQGAGYQFFAGTVSSLCNTFSVSIHFDPEPTANEASAGGPQCQDVLVYSNRQRTCSDRQNDEWSISYDWNQ